MAGNDQQASSGVKVVHVLGNLGPGGAEMGVIRLAEALNNHEFDHRILALGSNLSLQKDTGTDIPCYSLGLDGPSYTAFLSLAKALRSFKADLVHVNNLSPWFDAALAARLAGCACIQTFHGVEQGNLQFSRPKKMLFKAAARMSTATTAVAAPAAELLADLTGIPRQNIHVIPNGIDTDKFCPAHDQQEKLALRKSLDLPLDALLLGCVAAMRPVKNHSGLLHAFAQVADNAPKAYLVLVGEGILAKDLHQQAEQLGILDQVFFLGSRQDVPQLLRTFDLFVLNSQTEGLSYSILEAMASGLPIIATEVGANSELVDYDEQGWTYPVDNIEELVRLLKMAIRKHDILQTMSHNARAKIEKHYSFNIMGKKYAKLYRDISLSK